jgi:FMN-dependent NADH-azoreductase
MKVLHIDSSIRNERSVSKALSAYFMETLTAKFGQLPVDYLDLSVDTPSHPSALFVQGNYTPTEERSPEMIAALTESETLVDRLHNADIYVIGMPMYNFSVPSNFKVFIDNIVRVNRTFRKQDHQYEGLLKNKKVYIINTRGADFSTGHMLSQSMDQLQPYLEKVFGFMGLNDLTFINVSPVQFSGQEARIQAIENARKRITQLIQTL